VVGLKGMIMKYKSVWKRSRKITIEMGERKDSIYFKVTNDSNRPTLKIFEKKYAPSFHHKKYL
jgi:hypothetical protein